MDSVNIQTKPYPWFDPAEFSLHSKIGSVWQRIHVHLERTEAAFFCTIEDDGGGVSPSELPRLFDRIYRSENQKGNGVGIGLAIVKEIVSRHHGTITAENGERGLRMTISMPMLDRNLTKGGHSIMNRIQVISLFFGRSMIAPTKEQRNNP